MRLPQQLVSPDPLHRGYLEHPYGHKSFPESVPCESLRFCSLCFLDQASLHVGMKGAEYSRLLAGLIVHEGLRLAKSTLLDHLG